MQTGAARNSKRKILVCSKSDGAGAASYVSAMSGETELAVVAVGQGMWQWIMRLGAFGFIPLGLADASVIPLPGSMDILLIVLAAAHPEWWLYYAVAATVGAVIGGYVTYRLARKGGKEALEKRTKPEVLRKVERLFARSGFVAVLIAAILPPPIPMVAFLMAAGAAQYPTGRFVSALTLGRFVRYALLGYLSAHYGQQLLQLAGELEHPLPIALVTGLMLGGAAWFFSQRRRRAHASR